MQSYKSMGRALTRDAQAACDFSFSTSKFSPFFHGASVTAELARTPINAGVTVRVPPNPASIAEFEPLGTLFALTRYLATFKISHNANRPEFPHSPR